MAWHDPQDRHPDPLPAEFGKWLTPEESFGHLPDGIPSQELVNRLLKRLGDGKLVAAAAESRWREGGERKTRFLAVSIDPSWWLNAQDVQTSYCDLWKTGEFSCVIDYDDGMSGDDVRVNFYGVRFESGEMSHTVPGLRAARVLAKLPPLAPESVAVLREALANAPPPLTQEMLDTWEPASGALRRFPGRSDHAVLDWLWGRLISGKVAAGAEEYQVEGRDEPPRVLRVPAKWWKQAPDVNNVHHAFWEQGDVTLRLKSTSEAYAETTLRPVRIFNVRFEPADFWKIEQASASSGHQVGLAQAGSDIRPVPMPPTPSAPPTPHKAAYQPAPRTAPKVPRPKLKEYVRDFASRNPGSPFGVILQNAKMKFEPHFRVTERPTKDVIAELGLTLSQGNPLTLQK